MLLQHIKIKHLLEIDTSQIFRNLILNLTKAP